MADKKNSIYVRENWGTDAGRFNFDKTFPVLGAISAIAVIVSIIIISTKGFVFGIDFAGGTEVQVKFSEPVEVSQVRSFMNSIGQGNATVQSFDESNEVIIRMEAAKGGTDDEINEKNLAQIEQIKTELQAKLPLAEDGILRVDSVGPQVGSDLKRNRVLAIFYSLLAILIYVGLRFDYKYAPGAIAALFHDAMVTLAVFSLFDFEVNIQIMAAVLTLIGYSINDTIVTFDRIRENVDVYRGKSFRFIVNRSLNDVLSRTILTSGTTFVAVCALYFIGTGVIRDLAFTLMIGIIIGTFSSIWLACPILIYLEKLSQEARAKKLAKAS